MRIPIEVDIYPHSISKLYYNDREGLFEFLLAIDLEIAEIDFTIELIKRLKSSLEGDLPLDEIKNI